MTPATVLAAPEIDASTAPLLRAQVWEAIDAHHGETVVVDMSQVEFIDSTGLGVLVGALKHARRWDGDLALVGMQPMIVKILHVTGLAKVFVTPVPG